VAEALHTANFDDGGETRAAHPDDLDSLAHLQVGERLIEIPVQNAVNTFYPVVKDKAGIAVVAQHLTVADHARDANG
jgi:hypothetical protein